MYKMVFGNNLSYGHITCVGKNVMLVCNTVKKFNETKYTQIKIKFTNQNQTKMSKLTIEK